MIKWLRRGMQDLYDEMVDTSMAYTRHENWRLHTLVSEKYVRGGVHVKMCLATGSRKDARNTLRLFMGELDMIGENAFKIMALQWIHSVVHSGVAEVWGGGSPVHITEVMFNPGAFDAQMP